MKNKLNNIDQDYVKKMIAEEFSKISEYKVTKPSEFYTVNKVKNNK